VRFSAANQSDEEQAMHPYEIITPFPKKMGPLAKITVKQATQIFSHLIEELQDKPGYKLVSPNSPFVQEVREKFVLLRRLGEPGTDSALIQILQDDSTWPSSVDPDFKDAFCLSLTEQFDPTLEDAMWYMYDDQSASDGFFVKDLELRYVYVNPAMERFLGRDFSSIMGRKDSDFHTDDEVERLMAGYHKALEGQLVRFRRLRTCEGVQRLFFESYVARRSLGGERTGLYGIIRDVTDRKSVILPDDIPSLDGISPKMRQTMIECLKVSDSDSIVLLLGESGSGKDHLAHYIHAHSKRAGDPFEVLNSAALPADMIEAELFGYEPGAFTGANKTKKGLLEIAENGTLLLNEIGEIPLHLQAKLLTFLDSQTFWRLGGSKKITVKARLIAATNRDLKKEVAAGTFRKDLFYRLNVFQIQVPPLRERIVEIPNLVQELLKDLTKRMRLEKKPAIDRQGLTKLFQYDWPGNVRELRNVLERGIITGGRTEVDLGWFPERHERDEPEGGAESITPFSSEEDEEHIFNAAFPVAESYNDLVDRLKRTLLNEALRRCGGKKAKAARILGMTRDALNRQLKTLGYPVSK
jgi:PAS domain S-box-containing protein